MAVTFIVSHADGRRIALKVVLQERVLQYASNFIDQTMAWSDSMIASDPSLVNTEFLTFVKHL